MHLRKPEPICVQCATVYVDVCVCVGRGVRGGINLTFNCRHFNHLLNSLYYHYKPLIIIMASLNSCSAIFYFQAMLFY